MIAGKVELASQTQVQQSDVVAAVKVVICKHLVRGLVSDVRGK